MALRSPPAPVLLEPRRRGTRQLLLLVKNLACDSGLPPWDYVETVRLARPASSDCGESSAAEAQSPSGESESVTSQNVWVGGADINY